MPWARRSVRLSQRLLQRELHGHEVVALRRV